jgi:hypothetical protein
MTTLFLNVAFLQKSSVDQVKDYKWTQLLELKVERQAFNNSFFNTPFFHKMFIFKLCSSSEIQPIEPFVKI